MIKWIISWLLFSVYAGVVDVVLSVKLYFYIGTFARGCQYFIAPRLLFYMKNSHTEFAHVLNLKVKETFFFGRYEMKNVM